MNNEALNALGDVLDALEEACGLLKRMDYNFGLTEEQERAMVSMSYDYDRLVDDYNRMEKEYINYEL
jgi:hypothetical protein